MVRDCLAMFGPHRSMTASNFPFQGDGLDATTLYAYLREWVSDLPELEQRALFHDTAARFYSL